MEQNRTLDELISKLDDKESMYVFTRSNTLNDKEAYESCGFNKGWFFNKEKERRGELNEIASMIRKDRMFAANRKLAEAYERAVEVKIEGLRYNDKRLKQNVATEIIDRNIGKPTQKAEVAAKDGELVIKVKLDEND